MSRQEARVPARRVIRNNADREQRNRGGEAVYRNEQRSVEIILVNELQDAGGREAQRPA